MSKDFNKSVSFNSKTLLAIEHVLLDGLKKLRAGKLSDPYELGKWSGKLLDFETSVEAPQAVEFWFTDGQAEVAVELREKKKRNLAEEQAVAVARR